MREDKRVAGPFIKGLLKSSVNSGRAARKKMWRWWRVWSWDWFYYRRVIRQGYYARQQLDEIRWLENLKER